MPSRAKRRKAAKKKKKEKEHNISNGDGELMTAESDTGENSSSSPASQDLEPQQNPFNKDDEHKELSPRGKSMEKVKDGNRDILNGDWDAMETMGEADKSDNGGNTGFSCSSHKESTSGSLDSASVDDGCQHVIKNKSNLIGETESLACEIKDDADGAQLVESTVDSKKESDTRETLPVGKSVGSNASDLEKVHPVGTSTASKKTNPEKLPLAKSDAGRPSDENVDKQMIQSNTQITDLEWLDGRSDVPQSAEKEPLLLKVPKPVNKTSWTGCCGLVEMFTDSGR